MNETKFGIPRFPSLVESALVYREPAWRARDLELEQQGKHGRRQHSRKRLPAAQAARIRTLLVSGWKVKDVCVEVGRAEKTVRRVLSKLDIDQMQERDRNLVSGTHRGAPSQSATTNIVRGQRARVGSGRA